MQDNNIRSTQKSQLEVTPNGFEIKTARSPYEQSVFPKEMKKTSPKVIKLKSN